MATPSDVGANPEGTGDLERGIEEMGLGGAEAEEGAAPPAPMVERPLPAFPRPARGDVLSIAPMMEWTDKHYRHFMRLLTRRTRLYTEMIVDETLAFTTNPGRFLSFEDVQHPVAAQLGGNTPEKLAAAAALCQEWGFDEVNLNCGCPSNKVAGACFGAALMLTPETVRDCATAMVRAVAGGPAEITIKCRLGADDMNTYEEFRRFVDITSESGVRHYIVHARICLLSGLSTKDNRTVPPLHYEWIYRIARERPHLRFSLNGGVVSVEDCVDVLLTKREDTADGIDSGPRASKPQKNEQRVGVPGMRKRGQGYSRAAKAVAKHESVDGDEGSSTPLVEAGPVVEDKEEASGGGGGGGTAEAREAKKSGKQLKRERRAAARARAAKERVEAGAEGEAGSPPVDDDKAGVPTSTLGVGGAGGAEPKIADASIAPESRPAGQHRGTVWPDVHSQVADMGNRLIDSVMVGRFAYNNPWAFADVDRRLFGVPNPGLSRREVLAAYCDYVERVLEKEGVGSPGNSTRALVAPLIRLFAGAKGGAEWRREINKQVNKLKVRDVRTIVGHAMGAVPDRVLDEKPPLA